MAAPIEWVKLLVMPRWLDFLLLRSKQARRGRQMDRESAKRDADAQAAHRQRQAHYRDVTQSDARGRDTSGGGKDAPPSPPRD
jgi:hypothetical protein